MKVLNGISKKLFAAFSWYIVFCFAVIILVSENTKRLILLRLDKKMFTNTSILFSYVNFMGENDYNVTDTIAVAKKIFANMLILFTHMDLVCETRIYRYHCSR